MESNTLRPFYFTVIFWGEVHRRYFLDLLLASLLSPKNIPAINPARKSKFLIVTTRVDWDALQSEPLFQQMRRYVEPVWFEMPFPEPHESKMLVMSKGHRIVSKRAFDDQAYGVYVTPDLVLSDGSLAAMERLAEEGRKVVLSVAIRFQQEPLLEEMAQQGYFKPGQPLVLPARDLMRMALRHLHTETLRYEFDAPYFTDYPISVYWWVPKGNGMIIYSFSWAPLVVNYGALHHHDASTFEKWTVDGDYIYRNFPDPKDVYVVTDSDEIVLVSFTSEKDLHFDLVRSPGKQWKSQFLMERTKVTWIRSIMNCSVMDPLKRSVFKQPVFLHSAELDKAWQCRRRETDQIIDRAHRTDLEGRFLADISFYMGTGQSRFSDWVIQRYNKEDVVRDSVWWAVILFWLAVIKPIRSLRTYYARGVARPYWIWRYRRFVWWELKEKLGLVEERHYHWQNSGWEAPAVGLVCPLFTIRWLFRNCRWLWCYRRFVWWRLKEKLGLVEERHYHWENSGWEAPAVSLVCPIYSIRWMWRYRYWLLKQLKPGGLGIRGILHFLRSGAPNPEPPVIQSASDPTRSRPSYSSKRS